MPKQFEVTFDEGFTEDEVQRFIDLWNNKAPVGEKAYLHTHSLDGRIVKGILTTRTRD